MASIDVVRTLFLKGHAHSSCGIKRRLSIAKNQQMGPRSLYISCLKTTIAWALTPCLKTTNQLRTCHFYVIFEKHSHVKSFMNCS